MILLSEWFSSEYPFLRMRNKSERELCPNEIDPNGGHFLNNYFKISTDQCCGSKTFCYGSESGSDFSMSFGSWSDFQKVPDPVSNPTLYRYLVSYNGKNSGITYFFCFFKNNVYIHFRIQTLIWNFELRIRIRQKVSNPYGSESTTLVKKRKPPNSLHKFLDCFKIKIYEA
jgi:hypothetical protein